MNPISAPDFTPLPELRALQLAKLRKIVAAQFPDSLSRNLLNLMSKVNIYIRFAWISNQDLVFRQ